MNTYGAATIEEMFRSGLDGRRFLKRQNWKCYLIKQISKTRKTVILDKPFPNVSKMRIVKKQGNYACMSIINLLY